MLAATGSTFDVRSAAFDATARIRDTIHRTPVVVSEVLCKRMAAQVFLKLESQQITGSFKVRGASNKILSLENQGAVTREIVTASSGNHGYAVAYLGRKLSLPVKVFVAESAADVKVSAIRNLGVEVIRVGHDSLEAELAGRETARESKAVFVSPYNDLDVVAGQATIGVELFHQIPRIDAVLVPVGGGGLISGVGGFLKSVWPGIEVVGCQPKNSALMAESIRAGWVVERPSLPTLSDGTAGGIEKNSVTFELCRHWVDSFISLEEEEIAQAIRFAFEEEHLLLEGAGALPLAALVKERERFRGRRTVLVLSGSRIGIEDLRSVIH